MPGELGLDLLLNVKGAQETAVQWCYAGVALCHGASRPNIPTCHWPVWAIPACGLTSMVFQIQDLVVYSMGMYCRPFIKSP